ncbi:2-hydroxyacid dehydrogenase [Oryzibacter oryziterrae]|uniref:2-hydroxyacid dehydrogenase n=1 Tax=Oryzibacter oryziterrae TaxID=2766474 RepID=UPI001F47E3DC|nr:glyoxylate/hydroxypyruvate reductase A [Oryzibacter oryziterrae]
MSILIAVKGWNPDHWIHALKAQAPDRQVVLASEAFDRDAIRYALVWKPEPGLLKSLPNLQVIFSLGAGVDHLTTDPQLPDLPVVRIVDPDLTQRMTEWVLLQVLMHHRQHFHYAAAQAAGQWRARRQWGAADVRVGVMGLGVLGLDAIRALKALGFQLRGWSRTPKVIEGVQTWAGDEGLAPFLAATDILVSLLPLTAETTGLIDARLIDGLAKDGPLGGPVLINAGRGRSQVEGDVNAALRDGRLKGASLDVFAVEPLPHDSPLWTAPNLIITPHVAAESDPVALSAYVLSQIAGHEAGAGLANLVDRKLGY